MIDNFKNNQLNEILSPRLQQQSFGAKREAKMNLEQTPDEFVKSEISQTFSKGDIIDFMTDSSYTRTIEALITKGFALNYMGSVAINRDVNDKIYAAIGVKNRVTEEVERYEYSLSEFLDIMLQVKDKKTELYPEEKESFDKLYEKLIDFLTPDEEL